MKDYSGANVDEISFDSSTTTPSTEGCDEAGVDLSEAISPNYSDVMPKNYGDVMSTNFVKLMSDMSNVESTSLNPPDIIANEFHRPSNNEVEKDSDLLNEPIVLPDHLQRLVDEAMKDILCQVNES